MRKSLSNRINIFLSLDRDILSGYYNSQDNSPLYRRQLSYDFEQYILSRIRSAGRNAKIYFNISYRNEQDTEYAEPLMLAVRSHFSESKAIMADNFENFKRRTFKLLFVSLSVVMICHGVLPLLIKEDDSTIHSGLRNSLDVFSWVILWKPIDRLIFYWNPFLKDIALLEKLEKAEIVMNEIED
jgi:hypothetical protein